MQIKHAQGLPDTAYVRILCAGREMRAHDSVTLASSAVLHVTFALEPPPPCPPSPDRSKVSIIAMAAVFAFNIQPNVLRSGATTQRSSAMPKPLIYCKC
eukprot:684495-Pelagomonas_calceolata.AAC.1